MKVQCSIWLVLCSLLAVQAQEREPLVFQITYRDFLSGTCMFKYGFEEEYRKAFGDDACTAQTYFTYNYGTGNCPCGSGLCLNPSGGIDYCTFMDNWEPYFLNASISGHPDFDFGNAHLLTGARCGDVNFPAGSCRDKAPFFDGKTPDPTRLPIVNSTLVVNHAGLPKMEYCDSAPRSQCGVVTGTTKATQSSKEYFDVWFNDDPKFNKRIGQDLFLVNRPAGSATFSYQSGTNSIPNDDENAQFADIFDLSKQRNNFFGPLDRFKIEGSLDQVLAADYDSPFDAPAWPGTYSNQQFTANSNAGWSYSTEVHAFFEYRSDQDMSFSFSGDDDFWCFINGIMAIDLNGLHGIRTEGIDLTLFESELGLVDGNTYTLDIFQLERRFSGSNFGIETTLFEGCNIGASGTTTLDLANLVATNTVDDVLLLSRASSINSNNLFLKSEGEETHGYVWTKEKANLAPGFVCSFTFEISSQASEGLALVFHSRPEGLTNLPVSTGKNLNFKGLSNSLAIAIDLCTDRSDPNSGCQGQEVRLHYPGSPSETNSVRSSSLRVYDNILRVMKAKVFKAGDAATTITVNVQVKYYENPDFLEVFIDKSLFLRESNFSFPDVIGDRAAHVGFTTSGGDAAVKITDWTLDTVEVFAEKTITDFDTANTTNQIVIADGESLSPGYNLQTRDFCGNLVTRGGLASSVKAKYVERSNETSGSLRRLQGLSVVDADVADNGDGTYTVALVTDVVASYDLYVSFGTGNISCDIFTDAQGSTVDVTFNNVSGCFFASVENAATSLPIPPPPTLEPTPEIILPPTEVDEELVVVAGSVGGTLGFMAVVAAFLAIVYRRRWQRDKEFINDGRMYKNDAQTKFDPNDKLSAAGAQLLASRQAILRMRAQASNSDTAKELHKLQQESEELMEQIRIAKQKLELKGVAPEVVRPTAPREVTKMEF